MHPLVHFLHVAVGVIQNQHGAVLIAQRAAHRHQGGLWEFSGGKVEKNESVEDALRRELYEELGIIPLQIQPLIKIQHHYPDISVLLDVWRVKDFSGTAYSKENQPIQWVQLDKLKDYAFPPANLPILKALQLPDKYAILDDGYSQDLFKDLNRLLEQGIRLIQARFKHLPTALTQDFMRDALPVCQKYNAKLLLNSASSAHLQTIADGVHLTTTDLMKLTQRPVIQGLIGASCHHLAQLQHAEKIGVDFAVLAPVLPTLTHPNTPCLGWDMFNELTNQVNLPVYALGGMQLNDRQTAINAGGQGIAAIRAFLA